MSDKSKRGFKKSQVVSLVVLGLILAGVFFYPLSSYQTTRVNGNAGIAIARPPANEIRKLDMLPVYDDKTPQNSFQVELIGADASGLDLTGRQRDLSYASFDSKTIWPTSLPSEFNPALIMETGKNPGLNIRKLHQNGITGKGVGIAIFDELLLTDHKEYRDNLKFYEEIHASYGGGVSNHGSAVSSIAVGKSVGVAPDANLYYIAVANESPTVFRALTQSYLDLTYLAEAVNRIVDLNQTLPPDQKIRVMSMSIGWKPEFRGYEEIDAAVNRAKGEGILVISTVMGNYFGVNLAGLERDPLKDADKLDTYQLGLFLQPFYYKNLDKFDVQKTLWVPMDSRTTASRTGSDDYVFFRSGGLSWTAPYLAGLYSLCCQVKPDITPEQFLAEAIATGDVIQFTRDGQNYQIGTVPNPERLIARLQGMSN